MRISLSQYYTTPEVSNLFASLIDFSNVESVIDLGAGEGALVNEVYKELKKKATYVVADIDKSNCLKLKDNKEYKVYNIDCTNQNLSQRLHCKYSTIDMAVCNPPYGILDNTDFYTKLLDNLHLGYYGGCKSISSDLIFLAYNLLFLRENGVLAIILPNGALSGERYKKFREGLFSYYTVEQIVELPEKAFDYTEAKTGIFVIRKKRPDNSLIQLNRYVNGQLGEPIFKDSSLLYNRIDFRESRPLVNVAIAGEAKIEIRRGKFTHKYLKESKSLYFHTTHFKTSDGCFRGEYDDKISVASKNSFLMARVGKRCVGKVLLVKDGNIRYSDCVYNIIVPKKYISCFVSYFESTEYKEWIKDVAHGICSFVMTKGDVEEMLLRKIAVFRKVNP